MIKPGLSKATTVSNDAELYSPKRGVKGSYIVRRAQKTQLSKFASLIVPVPYLPLCSLFSAYWGLFNASTSSSPPEGTLWYAWPKMGRLKLITPEIALSKPWWYLIGSYPNFDTTVPKVEQYCATCYILIDPQLSTVMSWCISDSLLAGLSFLLPLVVLPGTTFQINYLLLNSHFKVFF